MKFIAVTPVALAAVLAMGVAPAFALPNYDGDYYNTPYTAMVPPVTVVTTAPPANSQSADQARQDYYQNRLDTAQAKADQAISERDQALADRDAARDRVYDNRIIDEDQTDDIP